MVNLYDLFGVEQEASLKEIKHVRNILLLRFHPDRNPDDPIAEDAFKQVVEAYEILSDSDKRQMYDSLLSRKEAEDIEMNYVADTLEFLNRVRVARLYEKNSVFLNEVI